VTFFILEFFFKKFPFCHSGLDPESLPAGRQVEALFKVWNFRAASFFLILKFFVENFFPPLTAQLTARLTWFSRFPRRNFSKTSNFSPQFFPKKICFTFSENVKKSASRKIQKFREFYFSKKFCFAARSRWDRSQKK